MTAKAIICELNPLHNGHRYIIDEAKRSSDCVIGIMSGNFTQRSEPAIFDKYTRAEDALKAGIDIVLELPFPWSSSSAAFFAEAGVSLAKSIGAEGLLFASECGDVSEIINAAQVSAQFDRETAKADAHSSDGIAAKREKYAIEHGVDPSLYRLPNNILATEYARFAGESLSLCTVKRQVGEEYASASEVREILAGGGCAEKYVPDMLYKEYMRRVAENRYASAEKLADIERYVILFGRLDPSEIFDADGGIGKRIYDGARQSVSGYRMLEISKTKKYTDSRIRRAALYMTLGVTEADVRRMPEYTLLLGTSETGREYLSHIRKSCRIPIVTKPADARLLSNTANRQFELSSRADMLWCECSEKPLKSDSFIKKHPVII